MTSTSSAGAPSSGAPGLPGLVACTDRIILRELRWDDADFVLGLVNEPSWLRHIGDRGVRTLDDAVAYLRDGPMAMYARAGYGLWLVERREDSARMGMCGLLRRDALECPDLGFAFRPAFWGQGYAEEAARASLSVVRQRLGIQRVLAIVSPGNASSIRLLGRLGFTFDSMTRLSEDAHEVQLYESDAGAGVDPPYPGS